MGELRATIARDRQQRGARMTRDFSKVWDLFSPPEQIRARWMLVLVILMAIVETAGVVSITPFLTVLSRPGIIHDVAWLNLIYQRLGLRSERDFIALLGAASIVTVVTSSLFKLVTQHTLNRFIHLQRYSISARLLGRYLNQPYEFFLARNPAELGKNLLSEVDQLLFNLIQPLGQMIAQSMIVLAMAAVIVVYDPSMAFCILTVVGLLYGLIYGLVRTRLRRIGRELVEANAARYKACNEALGGIKDVKITHAGPAYLQAFNVAARLFSRHLAANETLGQVPQYLVEAAGYSGLIIIALVLLVRTDDVAHVMPALGLYGFAAYRMLPAAQIIYRGFARLKFSSAALDSIHRDLTLPEQAAAGPGPQLAPRREIRLEGVRYAYPSTPDKPVFEGLDLVVPANASVGIVGRSGAGKSTLMDILLGLLQPQAGRLCVDGVSITAANVVAWQRAIGYVPQHIYLADASVAENIAFGLPRQSIDMQAVERAGSANSRLRNPRTAAGLRHPARRSRHPAVGRAAPAHRYRPRALP
jgi:ABC-type multidrug transport system fused ATPase/permease subunit